MITTTLNDYSRGKLDHDMNGRHDSPMYLRGFDKCDNFFVDKKGFFEFRPAFKWYAGSSNYAQNQSTRTINFDTPFGSYFILFVDNINGGVGGSVGFSIFRSFANQIDDGIFPHIPITEPQSLGTVKNKRKFFNEIKYSVSGNEIVICGPGIRPFVIRDNNGTGFTWSYITGHAATWFPASTPGRTVYDLFSIATNVGVGANWKRKRSESTLQVGTTYTHTPGSTEPLTFYFPGKNANSNSIVSGYDAQYDVETGNYITLECTIMGHGTITMKAGDTGGSCTLPDSGTTGVLFNKNPGSQAYVTLTPSADFNGVIIITPIVGDPSCCKHYKGRLYLGGFTAQATVLKASRINSFNDFLVKSTDNALDTDPISIKIAEISKRLYWIEEGMRNLLVGNEERISTIKGDENGVITPTNIMASLGDAIGTANLQPVKEANFMLYVGNTGKDLYYFRFDFLTDGFVSEVISDFCRDYMEEEIADIMVLKDKFRDLYILTYAGNILQCKMAFKGEASSVSFVRIVKAVETTSIMHYYDNGDFYLAAQEPARIWSEVNQMYVPSVKYMTLQKSTVYVDRTDFQTGDEKLDTQAFEYMLLDQIRRTPYLDSFNYYDQSFGVLHTSSTRKSLRYYPETGIFVMESHASMSFGSFNVGDVFSFRPYTGYEFGTFKITEILSSTQARVEVMVDPSPTLFQKEPDDWGDSGYFGWYIGYRNFETIEVPSDFHREIHVVANGNYLGKFTPSAMNPTINLGRKVETVYYGDSYEAIAKTFPLGYPTTTGENTQVTNKIVKYATLRLMNSVGGKFGTDPYKLLAPIQKFASNGYFDYMALPMNGDIEVSPTDEHSAMKCLYFKKEDPGPFKLTAAFIDIEFGG